ncbi:MAG: FixH family protein [Burkholderiales bacterium]|nr:FixH family protein [Burkholderiales bacterium]
MSANDTDGHAWYREPWPWILMSGPAIVVVAGLVTAWLAVRSDDGLVLDDYYKQGLAINQTLSRGDTAARLGLKAELQLIDGRLLVLLNGAGPGELSLRIAHPTRAGMDQRVTLAMVRPGVYEGRLQPLRAGRWRVVLEQKDWRLAGDWTLPAEGILTLEGHLGSSGNTGFSKQPTGGKP